MQLWGLQRIDYYWRNWAPLVSYEHRALAVEFRVLYLPFALDYGQLLLSNPTLPYIFNLSF